MMTMIFTPEMTCLDTTSHWTLQRKTDYMAGLPRNTEVLKISIFNNSETIQLGMRIEYGIPIFIY